MKICLILEINFNTQTGNKSYELFQSALLSLFNDHFTLQTKNIYNKADRKSCVTQEY